MHPTEQRTDTGQFALVPIWLAKALTERSPRSGSVALSVYVIMATWADYGSGECWPSHRTIADEAGMSTDAVRAALNLLREVGAVEWVSRSRDDGGAASNVYRLLRVRHGGATAATPGLTSMGGHGLDSPAPPVLTSTTNDTHVERDPIERHIHAPTSAAAAHPDPSFDALWSMYPRKVAKPNALRAWNKIAARDRAAVADGLTRWCAYWSARGEPEFVPHPATWLNRRGWEDAVPPMPTRQRKTDPSIDALRERHAEQQQARAAGRPALSPLQRFIDSTESSTR
jgi:hypothetical protein